jgi:hypothetical protein
LLKVMLSPITLTPTPSIISKKVHRIILMLKLGHSETVIYILWLLLNFHIHDDVLYIFVGGEREEYYWIEESAVRIVAVRSSMCKSWNVMEKDF